MQRENRVTTRYCKLSAHCPRVCRWEISSTVLLCVELIKVFYPRSCRWRSRCSCRWTCSTQLVSSRQCSPQHRASSLLLLSHESLLPWLVQRPPLRVDPPLSTAAFLRASKNRSLHPSSSLLLLLLVLFTLILVVFPYYSSTAIPWVLKPVPPWRTWPSLTKAGI